MSTYKPKKKTLTGMEEVTFPISSVKGLQNELDNLNDNSLSMPKIRLGSVGDKNGSMIITLTNPLTFAVHITDGKLQVGDAVQICTRQLFTYNQKNKRKYKLRAEWQTIITNDNVNDKVIFVDIGVSASAKNQRLFKTGNFATFGTLSPLYIRIRRPIYNSGGVDINGKFSNIVTVWKKYITSQGKIFIK